MKILMLGWELPPHNSGGLGVACYHMAKSLAKKGTDISFVLPYDAEHDINFMQILPATELKPEHRFGGAYQNIDLEAPIPGAEMLSIRDVQRLYGQFVAEHLADETTKKAEVVHSHDWLTLEAGMIAKREFGLPLIAHIHATEFDRAGGGTGNPLIHEIEREGLLLADEIIAVSNLTKQIIVEKYGIPADKIKVAHNGFDADEWGAHDYDASRYRYLESLKQKGKTIVATTARLTVQKGMSYLLEGFRAAKQKNPDLTLVIAGDGEQRDELLRLSAEKGVAEDVLFTGFVRGRELRDIYTLSDVFVMSSCSEPFGLTAFEAAHHGDALVLTKQSGASEVLQIAFKYDFWDTNRLGDILFNLSSSAGLQSEMRQNVAREYRKLPWDKVTELILHSYQRWTA